MLDNFPHRSGNRFAHGFWKDCAHYSVFDFGEENRVVEVCQLSDREHFLIQFDSEQLVFYLALFLNKGCVLDKGKLNFKKSEQTVQRNWRNREEGSAKPKLVCYWA